MQTSDGFEHVPCSGIISLGPSIEKAKSAIEGIQHLQISYRTVKQPFLSARQFDVESLQNLCSDLVLQCKRIIQQTIIVLGPDDLPRHDVSQFQRDADALPRSLHCPLKNVADAHFASRLLGSHIRVAISVGGSCGNQEQSGSVNKCRLDAEAESICKVVASQFAVEIGERQDRDRGFLW